MSSSAGTPSAPSFKVAGSGRASSIEPSPASTYGGSVSSDAGDGGPQTPLDGTFFILLGFLLPCLPTVLSIYLRISSLALPPFPPRNARNRQPSRSPCTHLLLYSYRFTRAPKFGPHRVQDVKAFSALTSPKPSAPSLPLSKKLPAALHSRSTALLLHAQHPHSA